MKLLHGKLLFVHTRSKLDNIAKYGIFITRVSWFTTIHQNLLKIYLEIEINLN